MVKNLIEVINYQNFSKYSFLEIKLPNKNYEWKVQNQSIAVIDSMGVL